MTISSILSEDHAEHLILAYCATLFPKFRHLFKQTKLSQYAPTPKAPRVEQENALVLANKQKFLTELQVATIGKSQAHYNFFLLLTLAREPIAIKALETGFDARTEEGAAHATVGQIIQDFSRVKLVGQEKDFVFSISQDVRFPVPDTETLKTLQKKFNQWNLEFDQNQRFEQMISRTLIRRVSPRYINIISSQCNLLFDILRSSEELNTAYNEDIVMLHLKLSKGKLRG